MADMTVAVLVDGSNVAHSTEWRAASGLEEQADRQRRLVDVLCSWAVAERHSVTVTFDGAGPWGVGSVKVSASVEVVGSGDEEGDELLERLAAGHRREGRPYWVVSSDAAVRQLAGGAADRVVRAAEFVADIDSPAGPANLTAWSQGPDPTRLVETIDADVRARLEQMRRGDT